MCLPDSPLALCSSTPVTAYKLTTKCLPWQVTFSMKWSSPASLSASLANLGLTHSPSATLAALRHLNHAKCRRPWHTGTLPPEAFMRSPHSSLSLHSGFLYIMTPDRSVCVGERGRSGYNCINPQGLGKVQNVVNILFRILTQRQQKYDTNHNRNVGFPHSSWSLMPGPN